MKATTVTNWEPSSRVVRGNAAEQVLNDLRAQILSGRFPRGAKLPTEKELGIAYGVSNNTVREAIRGLTTAHLVDVKHGSGAYVTAHVDQLIARSLRSIIQVGNIGVADVFATYGAVNSAAAELAAKNATPQDIEELQEALDAVTHATSSAAIAKSLIRFLDVISEASRNPLLALLCRFLARLQVDLYTELSGSYAIRRKSAIRLARDRQALVDAIRMRDPEAARAAARKYQSRALSVLTAMPHAESTPGGEPALSRVLTSLLQRDDEGKVALKNSAQAKSMVG